MKKTLIIVVTTVVVIGLGFLVSNHYQNNKPKPAVVVDELAITKDALVVEKAKNAELLALHEQVRIECERGIFAHDSLTPFAKAKAPRPNCGQAVVTQ